MFSLQTGSFCADRRRAGRSERRPFPEWATYTKHSIWIYDITHFAGCPRVAVITIMDLVTRKWICEVVSGEETSTQIQAAFCDASSSRAWTSSSPNARTASPILPR